MLLSACYHCTKKEAFIFQTELPAKASLSAKSAFSSTVIKIWSLVCTSFPETNMLSLQKLQPKFGHNS